MKINKIIKLVMVATVIAMVAALQSCNNFDYSDFNSPTIADDTADANFSVLQTLVTGAESQSRVYLPYYIDDVSVIGREYVRYSNSEPRYLSDLLGSGNSTLNNNTFYITNPWITSYLCVKGTNILISAARSSTQISDGQRLGYYAYAKTLQAYQLLMCLNLTDQNGIRLDVEDPSNLGPFVSKTDALTGIYSLLNDAATELSDPSCAFAFQTTLGFSDPASFLQLNKALAARVAAYRQDWPGVLSNLSQSFINKTGDLHTGAYHIFSSGANDILNPVFFPQNATGEVRGAEQHFVTDMGADSTIDDRVNKVPLRASPVSQQGLTSYRDVFIYTTTNSPIAIIRNEELILLEAEASIQTGAVETAIADLNIIRTAHGLPDYSGGSDTQSLLTEMLYERRYSLAFEGHRWVDLRRYNLLNTLPLDRPTDHVWSEFPIPLNEQQ